ncbi:MAG TPA: tetratricopeptide repeat protein [Polyangia bacterium]
MNEPTGTNPRTRAGHGQRPRAHVLTCVMALLAALLPAARLHAGEFEDASAKLSDMEERVRFISGEFRDTAPVDPAVAMRRVVDAEMLFKLKNYSEAATILLDVVEKYPSSQGYDDALVLLGQALLQEKDYNSARHYFQLAVQKNTGSRLEQQALQQLVEIGLHTGDFEHVDDYLKRLESIPVGLLEPSVPYVRGKYAFFRGHTDEALATFANIPPTSPYFLQSRYFSATAYVQKGDQVSALAMFDAITRAQPRNDNDKEIQEMARLALGRLNYEHDQFDKAREAYSSIPRQSLHFEEAMDELAWTSIKAKDFKAAYRALDLMLLQRPDSAQAPELRLLMGNLHVRLGNFSLANDAFMQARDQFDPIHRQLSENLTKCQADPKYFDSLIGKGMDKFDISVLIPKTAIPWVKADASVARLVNLTDDVGELQRGIKDSEQTLSRLELAVGGQLKVGIFPDLAAVRTRTSEVLNQIVELRKRFVAKMRALTAGAMSGEDKGRLEQIGIERATAEKELEGLPLTAAALHDREKRSRAALDQLDVQASELNVMVQGMEAELVAIEQYYIKSRSDQKIKPQELIQPVAGMREAIVELRAANDRIRNNIAEAAREATVGAATGDQDRGAIATLVASMKKERVVYQSARATLSGGDQRDFDAIVSVLERADSVQARLAELDGKIEAAAQKRLGELRQQLLTEKADLMVANSKLGGILTESQSLGGGLAFAMLSKVTDRFYDLVVQSDVGLVDVAWGLKDQRTSAVSKLINQQKLELKTVDEDFRALLEEEK